MRIPKRVKIGPYTYAVAYKETVLADDRAVLWGQCDFTSQTIFLSTIMTEQRQETAFMHEVLHALDEMVQAGLKEEQITALAPALWQFLRDNKMLKEGQ